MPADWRKATRAPARRAPPHPPPRDLPARRASGASSHRADVREDMPAGRAYRAPPRPAPPDARSASASTRAKPDPRRLSSGRLAEFWSGTSSQDHKTVAAAPRTIKIGRQRCSRPRTGGGFAARAGNADRAPSSTRCSRRISCAPGGTRPERRAAEHIFPNGVAGTKPDQIGKVRPGRRRTGGWSSRRQHRAARAGRVRVALCRAAHPAAGRSSRLPRVCRSTGCISVVRPSRRRSAPPQDVEERRMA